MREGALEVRKKPIGLDGADLVRIDSIVSEPRVLGGAMVSGPIRHAPRQSKSDVTDTEMGRRAALGDRVAVLEQSRSPATGSPRREATVEGGEVPVRVDRHQHGLHVVGVRRQNGGPLQGTTRVGRRHAEEKKGTSKEGEHHDAEHGYEFYARGAKAAKGRTERWREMASGRA